MKRRVPLLSTFFALLTILGISSLPVNTQADDHKDGKTFTDADIHGRYAFVLQGNIPGVGSAAATGVFTADGKGNVTDGIRTFNLAGTIYHQTFVCTYSVNPNGTGSADCPMTSFTPGPEVETFDFVLRDKGKQGNIVSTAPGIVILGTVNRQ